MIEEETRRLKVRRRLRASIRALMDFLFLSIGLCVIGLFLCIVAYKISESQYAEDARKQISEDTGRGDRESLDDIAQELRARALADSGKEDGDSFEKILADVRQRARDSIRGAMSEEQLSVESIKRDQKERFRARVRSGLTMSAQLNPEEVAEQARLSKASGVVSSDIEKGRQLGQGLGFSDEQLDNLIERAPDFVRKLAYDPAFSALVLDDAKARVRAHDRDLEDIQTMGVALVVNISILIMFSLLGWKALEVLS